MIGSYVIGTSSGDGFLYEIEAYSLDSSRLMGISPEVLNPPLSQKFLPPTPQPVHL